MNRIDEMEERIRILRAEIHSMTGRDRQTQQRMINEIANELARLRRERSNEMSSISWDEHNIVEYTCQTIEE